MDIAGRTALVTGANRGIGLQLSRALVARGATVYGGARNPAAITEPNVIPIELDVTDHETISKAAAQLPQTSIVINNAGIGRPGIPTAENAVANAREELEVNYIGTLAVANAFAPVLADNAGGALVNVLSVVSFVAQPILSTYSASKAAAWSITNSLRTVLAPNGTLVVGAHFGYVDTDLTAGFEVEKLDPADIANGILDAIANDEVEALLDEFSQQVKAGLSTDQTAIYPGVRADYEAALATAAG